ncbi:hypothetical protein FGO68_gene1949 [Halteria grandinella]|uniref:Uncharacterized protein n=1 Tax=Halteria grandinella TaxID=5974 RepID=A0A8J8NI82_HALGN|nr:hypothetical protein FGO68_gene1949 [Halteria grandinella]
MISLITLRFPTLHFISHSITLSAIHKDALLLNLYRVDAHLTRMEVEVDSLEIVLLPPPLISPVFIINGIVERTLMFCFGNKLLKRITLFRKRFNLMKILYYKVRQQLKVELESSARLTVLLSLSSHMQFWFTAFIKHNLERTRSAA